MNACWRVMTVLIVLLWTIGGLPSVRGRSTGDHTDDSSSVYRLVSRRFEAVMMPSDAGSGDDDAGLLRLESIPAFTAVALALPASAMARPMASTSIARPGSPRGPPSIG